MSLYERAIAADPNDANNLGDFANFMCEERRNLDRAEELYERAIAADPNHANALANFATFVWDERHNLDRAEELYERAIAADPSHANNLGSFANFMCDERRNLDRAEELYERAIAADPNHANNFGDFASFLFLTERRDEAIGRLREAIRQADTNRGPPDSLLASKVAFYRAVHLPDERDDALRALHVLIAHGVLLRAWDFHAHALFSEKAGDADANLFFKLASVLSGEAVPSELASFERWRATAPRQDEWSDCRGRAQSACSVRS